MKILIIALSGAGDVLMSTPLIKEIRKSYSDATIDCLVMQGKISRDVLKENKDIDNTIYYNFVEKGRINSLKFCYEMRKKNYDLSITVYPQARYYGYSFISSLINAKRRIGYNYRSHKLRLNRLFFTDLIEEEFEKHVVENNLKVLEVINKKPNTENLRTILNINKESDKFAKEFFKKNKIKKAAIIHAGSGITKNFYLKRWPARKFSELAKRLNKNKRYQIILVGNKDEEKLNNFIISQSKLKEGREIFQVYSDISDISAIINNSDVVIANDTVIGHIAAALNKKIISLFGPTSPENTAPYSKNKIVLCKRPKNVNPYIHGSNKITPEQSKWLDMISVKDVLENI